MIFSRDYVGYLAKQTVKHLVDATHSDDERMDRHMEGIARNIESFRSFEPYACKGDE